MCGIVGYYGPREPKDVLMSGLKKLEYRGYDSAGVAIWDKNEFRKVRAPGKLSELEAKLKSRHFDGHIGIGHTRWATHGVPSEKNAHPHEVGGVCLIANGIIENYVEIREALVKKGHEILSDTDSELVAHLISEEMKSKKDLHAAVEKVIPELHGAYAVLVVSKDEPNKMVAFKNGPPLVMGIGEKEILFASDIQAIVSYTKNVIYLEDGEVAVTDGAKYQVFQNAKPINKKIVQIDWSSERAEKQGYKHYMLKEIFEQPRAVAAAMAPHLDVENFTVQLKGVGFYTELFDSKNLDEKKDQIQTEKLLKGIERVFVVACGTSYYAGMIGEYLIERLARLPVEVELASEFRYRQPVIPKNSLVIVVSQSGETADTLAALKLSKEQGALCLSICNVKNSTIDREAHGHLYMNSGVEIGVASTKAFTSTLAVLNVLATYLGKIHGQISKDQETKLVKDLLAIPHHMESVLAYDKFFADAAQTLKAYKGFLYMGRGVSYPIALEGALKLKELAYMHAEGYAAGEMKHGPIALIDNRMAVVVIAPNDDVYEKTISNLEEVRARGGQIISISTGENEKLSSISEHYLSLPSSNWTTNALLSVIPVQLLAYHVAEALEYDVDQPRNLAKSVTVE